MKALNELNNIFTKLLFHDKYLRFYGKFSLECAFFDFVFCIFRPLDCVFLKTHPGVCFPYFGGMCVLVITVKPCLLSRGLRRF